MIMNVAGHYPGQDWDVCRNCISPWTFPVVDKFGGFTNTCFWKWFGTDIHLILGELCNSFWINGGWPIEDTIDVFYPSVEDSTLLGEQS